LVHTTRFPPQWAADETIGATGLIFTQMALKQKDGPKLTLYVRSRSKLSADTLSNPAVRIVEGSLTDERALEDAMTGVDSVVSFLGAYVSFRAFIWRIKTTPIADSFPTIFQAMRAQGVKRILALSTPAYDVSSEQKPWTFWLMGFMPALFVPQGNAEMVAIARSVAAQSDLDWTLFRVPHLNNGPAGLPLAAGLLGPDYKGSLELSRPSMARWALEEIKKGEWTRGAPALGNY
jgi:nucleoside-diphosphate-sugar epimerase